MMERTAEHRIEAYPHWNLDAWKSFDKALVAQALPEGRIERIYTHWSAHDYESVFPAYHFCVAMRSNGEIVVVNTHDVRGNMRDVKQAPEEPYAPHTRGRNSFALGISIMAMTGATPEDFGPHPLTPQLIDALCIVGARLAERYGVSIDPDHVMSHAEAALRDGYFGTAPEQRWDIARLSPDPLPLQPQEAIDVGECLRVAMRGFMDR